MGSSVKLFVAKSSNHKCVSRTAKKEVFTDSLFVPDLHALSRGRTLCSFLWHRSSKLSKLLLALKLMTYQNIFDYTNDSCACFWLSKFSLHFRIAYLTTQLHQRRSLIKGDSGGFDYTCACHQALVYSYLVFMRRLTGSAGLCWNLYLFFICLFPHKHQPRVEMWCLFNNALNENATVCTLCELFKTKHERNSNQLFRNRLKYLKCL